MNSYTLDFKELNINLLIKLKLIARIKFMIIINRFELLNPFRCNYENLAKKVKVRKYITQINSSNVTL